MVLLTLLNKFKLIGSKNFSGWSVCLLFFFFEIKILLKCHTFIA